MEQIEPSRPTFIDVMKEMIKTHHARAAESKQQTTNDQLADVNDEIQVQGIAVLSGN